MNYADLKSRVMQVRGVGTEERADGLIKAVAGHLVSRVDDTLAHDITGRLPEPLTFEELRGHRMRASAVSADQYIEGICHQFDLNRRRTMEVIRIVLHSLKADFSPEEVQSWESEMPADWVDLVEQA